MRALRREVGGPAWRRQGRQLTWLTVTALVALAMTLGVYAYGGRCQRAGLPVQQSIAP